jgi:hypothetical protein
MVIIKGVQKECSLILKKKNYDLMKKIGISMVHNKKNSNYFLVDGLKCKM